jgi:hypothetical protein
MSLATPPVSDALRNSKGVMSQDLEVSLHCHCNLQWQCHGRDFSSGGGILRGSNSALEERDTTILAYFSIMTYGTGAWHRCEE